MNKNEEKLTPSIRYAKQEEVIKEFPLNNKSKNFDLSFIDLRQIDQSECDEDFKNMISDSLKQGGRYALWVSEANTMSDDSENIYPLSADSIYYLRDAKLTDEETASTAKKLYKTLKDKQLNTINADQVTFGYTDMPYSLGNAEPIEAKENSPIDEKKQKEQYMQYLAQQGMKR